MSFITVESATKSEAVCVAATPNEADESATTLAMNGASFTALSLSEASDHKVRDRHLLRVPFRLEMEPMESGLMRFNIARSQRKNVRDCGQSEGGLMRDFVRTPTPWRMRRQGERPVFRWMKRGAIRSRAAGANGAHNGRTTMKEKPNYAELEKRVDFTALAGRLEKLSERDNPQRKTLFTLIDKVREQIVAARRNRNVSYQVLAKELTDAGIPVSEPTLRKYLRAQGVEKKQRKKAATRDGNGDGKPAALAGSGAAKSATPGRQHKFNLNV
jgi:hypothetical protein